MAHAILGLHHVTATADDAQSDLAFCTGALALRLVKKTVNFDNHNVYHFYYGDERGTPGTIWTTFPYKGWGVPVGRKGAGQIVTTSFSVPAGSLGWWKARLSDRGVPVRDGESRFGEESLVVTDASGLGFELVATGADERPAWPASPAGPSAIRGLHSVTMVVRDAPRSLDLLTGILGYEVVNEAGDRIRVAVNGDVPGRRIDIITDPAAPPARNGLGTVHHVAMAIATGEEQLALRSDLIGLGYQVTPVMDRQYFQSIYFREPGGVLFEVATMQPGFTVDEDVARLGHDLKLPPWEEPHRPDIEKNLPAVTVS